MSEFMLLTKYYDAVSTNETIRAFSWVAFVAIFVSFMFSGFSSVLITSSSFVIGMFVFSLLLKYKEQSVNVLTTLICKILKNDVPSKSNELEKEIKYNKRNAIHISQNIDSALEDLLTRVLENYVSTWYSYISNDKKFQYELRLSIQLAARNILVRLEKVNISDFILRKILPIYLNHAASCEESTKFQNISRLHSAVYNRKSEILYLRNVSDCILQYCVSESDLKCRPYKLLLRELISGPVLLSLSDVVCDPTILNMLFLKYANGDFDLSYVPNSDDQPVILLEKFTSRYKPNIAHSPVYPDLQTIMKDEELLYVFMDFLKTSNSIHLIQFCMHVEEFNTKIQKHDLTSDEMDNLYRDAWDIYSVYISNQSPYCVHCNEDIVQQLRKDLSKDVMKLRTSVPLSEAYKFVYSILQDDFCEKFYHSSQYFSWLYGQMETMYDDQSVESRRLQEDVKNNEKTEEVVESPKMRDRIKNAMRINPITEGQLYDNGLKLAYGDYGLMDLDVSVGTEFGEDYNGCDDVIDKKMSSWVVSIATAGTRYDSNTNKTYSIYVIHVQSDSGEEWLVERRIRDFYTLQDKLTEFHGTMSNANLPQRRFLSTYTGNIDVLEKYLQNLLKEPILNNSELLYSFLKSNEEFEETDSGFSRLLKKPVLSSLKKEKGQHLESFIQTFVTNAEKRPLKYEWKEVNEDKYDVNYGVNDVYRDNFGIGCDISSQVMMNQQQKSINNSNNKSYNDVLHSPCNCILFIMVKACKLPISAIRLMLTLHIFVGTILDIAIKYFLDKFMRDTITTTNISYFIRLLQRNIFENENIKQSNKSIAVTVQEILSKLEGSWIYPIYVSLLNSLQDPIVNKQLYYQIFDAVLQELEPELLN